MNNGLYTAFLGMRARQRSLDVIASNIANASTTGFKADLLFYNSFENEQSEAQSAAANGNLQTGKEGVLAGSTTNFAAGAIRQTARPLDLALDGDGLIVVQTATGTRYTRAGSLNVNSAGQLVTQRGDLVVGENGPITLALQGEISVGEDGTISTAGRTIDRLKIVRFDDPRTALAKEGDSLFIATGAAQPKEAASTRVIQGALEGSNVNTVSEMVAMMQNSREFDSLQRSVTMMREIGRRVTGEIGKI